MIVVLGRPGLRRDTVGPDTTIRLDGLAAAVATEVAARGGSVELVGSVGDDADGDRIIVELGRRGVGHAALLRDPAGVTPGAARTGPAPRLDAGDIELGLRYVPDCRVVVVADDVDDAAAQAVADGAQYHGASVIVVVPSGGGPPRALAEGSTVLEAPHVEDAPGTSGEGDTDAADIGGAFAELVAQYAVEMDAGRPSGDAFEAAVTAARWDRATGA
jgi:hypothetical protein